MKNNYVVGNVVSIDGARINILMNEHSNLESFHYDDKIYDGISAGSYIGIIRGSNKIIGRVEKEFLEDKNNDPSVHEFSRNRFERHLEVRIIGNIYNSKFEFGIKIFPMIFNEAVLLTGEEVTQILRKDSPTSNSTIRIGKNVFNNSYVELDWDKLFNTHIGIFGNTGSGKSNTLAKLYTELFNLEKHKIKENFDEKSKFFIIDFNGEYINEGILRNKKKCFDLSTRTNKKNSDMTNDNKKLPLTKHAFWDVETLSILFSATEKTQKPFLGAAVNYFTDIDDQDITTKKIIEGLGESFYNIFKANNNRESLKLLLKSLDIINFEVIGEENWLKCLWHSQAQTYYLDLEKLGSKKYINNKSNDEILEKKNDFEDELNNKYKLKINELKTTDKLKIIISCYLIYCLSYGKANYEHIIPLIQRIESRSNFIDNTIRLCENIHNEWETLNIISLRNCNSEAKKILPLLIAKQLYNEHKNKSADDIKIESTLHLIIDEAHNILSSESSGEDESWKDYRLDVFEEIIKEGRKFGFYITLASQRPHDISPTIISQLHNYFIHRLVNDNDLKMIANTINSLDNISKSQIPDLAPGQCIITGTSFELPLLIQVAKLAEEKSPSSDNADLLRLWMKKQA
ncbi:helicase HerA domain-containing protein [Mycoplasma phocoeninasale]|uniref:helicase HerA domain-containing protein n=1 Tax=Mycoplasma phocoeninasale TaxID=2726117 RepID=UPI001966E753|nr:ATP-binding protein [Mycoplasma phocoeninasale]